MICALYMAVSDVYNLLGVGGKDSSFPLSKSFQAACLFTVHSVAQLELGLR